MKNWRSVRVRHFVVIEYADGDGIVRELVNVYDEMGMGMG